MTLGETIRKLRSQRGLSPGKLAEMSGVSRPYLWQLESGGKSRPSFEVLEKLAGALGVTVSEFSQGEAGTGDEGCGELPSGLASFCRERGPSLGIRKRDVDVMKNVNFRGLQPKDPEDWELLFLFLKKWAQ